MNLQDDASDADDDVASRPGRVLPVLLAVFAGLQRTILNFSQNS